MNILSKKFRGIAVLMMKFFSKTIKKHYGIPPSKFFEKNFEHITP